MVKSLDDLLASEQQRKTNGNHDVQPVHEQRQQTIVEPKLINMADVEAKPIRWLWGNRFPTGSISCIVGRPGCGKSFLTCDMTARITNGTDWPDGHFNGDGSVLLMACEDDPAMVIRPRLDAHGANVKRVQLLTSKTKFSEESPPVDTMLNLSDIDLIEKAIKKTPDCKMLIVDPIGSYLGGSVDSYRDNEVRAVLAPLTLLAEKYQLAVVLVVHTRKGSSSHADDLALGSRAFVGIARAVWHVMHDPENDGRHLMLPGKCNLSARPTGLAFSITGEPARIEWETDPVNMHANDVMSAGDDEGRTALDEACIWLELQLQYGSKPGKEIQQLANQDGISKRTLDRAKKKLKVESGPDEFGGPWVWWLSASHQYSSQCSPSYASVRQEKSMANSDETVANSHRCSVTGNSDNGEP